MLYAAFGITARVMAVPFAYDTLRLAGACYLLYLAYQAVRPGGRPPFQVRALAPDGPGKLFLMGLLTNLLNPKAAVMYLSLLPRFISPERGSVLGQSHVLGFTQIAVSICVNTAIVMASGSIALLPVRRPLWAVIPRWLMGMVLAALAVRMLAGARCQAS
ncbi:MAG: LysE family translocator [Paracoccus sp. (in: a-proteobacteria)]|nr:LysE family translocator [Paracoccus sp. (in: a-proteobacteria)]